MKQFDATILANRGAGGEWRELGLAWNPEAGFPRPGQFFTLRVSPRYDPLLRRPFAFAGLAARDGGGSSVSAIYLIRGSATALLSELAPGSPIDVLGPLGRPFPAPAPGETPVLAAGGVGLGPVLFLARELARGGRPPLLALGFRSGRAIPEVALPAGAVICTDDGSAGVRGNPVQWISRNVSSASVRLYACGPAAMLAGASALASERGWSSSLSAEQWMACGVGACMGCALPRLGGKGFLRACADGPVFDSPDPGGAGIDWAAEAARAAGRALAAGERRGRGD